MRQLVILVGGGIALCACAPKAEQRGDTAKAAATPVPAAGEAAKLGETGNMKTPESVRYDPELDVYYVSNINGNPSQKDNNGFIAVVRADSTGVVKMLAERDRK